MAWKGFVVESKSYLNHPDYWKERNSAQVIEGGWTMGDKRKAKLIFWLKFPGAFLRFYRVALRSALVNRL